MHHKEVPRSKQRRSPTPEKPLPSLFSRLVFGPRSSAPRLFPFHQVSCQLFCSNTLLVCLVMAKSSPPSLLRRSRDGSRLRKTQSMRLLRRSFDSNEHLLEGATRQSDRQACSPAAHARCASLVFGRMLWGGLVAGVEEGSIMDLQCR